MKQLKNFWILLMTSIILLFITSCSTISYDITNRKQVGKEIGYESGNLPFHMHPTDMDAPFPEQAGDVYMNGNVGHNLGFGMGVALNDKTYMVARYSGHIQNTDQPTGSTYLEADYTYTDYDGYTHYGDTSGYFTYSKNLELFSNVFDLGFGWYNKPDHLLRNEISFGGGLGKIRNEYNYTFLNHNNEFKETRKYHHVYLQDDIGWVKKNAEASFSGRFNSYFFRERTFEMAVWNEAPGYQTYALSLEGSFRLALGWKFLKPYMEITGTLPIASPEIEWEPFALKGGIVAKF